MLVARSYLIGDWEGQKLGALVQGAIATTGPEE